MSIEDVDQPTNFPRTVAIRCGRGVVKGCATVNAKADCGVGRQRWRLTLKRLTSRRLDFFSRSQTSFTPTHYSSHGQPFTILPYVQLEMTVINFKTILLASLAIQAPVCLAFRVEKHADLVLGRSFVSRQPLVEARHPPPDAPADQGYPPPPALSPLQAGPTKKPNFVNPNAYDKRVTPYLCGGFAPPYEDPVTLLPGKTHVETFKGCFDHQVFRHPHIETTFVDDVVAMGEEGAAAKRIKHEGAVDRDVERFRARKANGLVKVTKERKVQEKHGHLMGGSGGLEDVKMRYLR